MSTQLAPPAGPQPADAVAPALAASAVSGYAEYLLQENLGTPYRASVAGAVFLDTEFTSLERPILLSIGLCAADGRECYVELDPRGAAGCAAARPSESQMPLSFSSC